MWTEAQESIIKQKPSDCVVYAAPGSGKTAVLTAHCCQLLRTSLLKPANTMIMTFTKQAAIELKRRMLAAPEMTTSDVEIIRIGTFHAQLFRALLAVYPDIPVLLGPIEQRRMLELALRIEGMSQPRRIQEFQTALTRAHSAWPCAPVHTKYRMAALRYQSMKRHHHRWDFDDILTAACQVWETKPDFSLQFRRFQYLLVDEFQDTNQIQWHIITLVARMGAHVFVVGDDDQSIYGFRGASPTWLLEFPKYFDEVEEHHLATNFRCDQSIVDRATHLIQHNRTRVAKPFACASEREGTCHVEIHKDEFTEAYRVCLSIQNSIATNPNVSIAILARTRQQLYCVWNQLQFTKPVNVQCRTFHDAKGKEWDIVHVVGAVASNPYLATPIRSLEVEEERRLFYVAMTRARHALHIHVPRFVKGRKLSALQFIDECGF